MNILTRFTSIGGDSRCTTMAVASALGIEPDAMRTTPTMLIGSAAEVVDKLLATREQLGISYVVVHDTAIDAMGPVVAKPAGT